MLATEYAAYCGIAPQGEDESDYQFRSRVSGALRDMGNIIEAHEALRDKRYDESADAMTGIIGAIAQEFRGVTYHSRGEQQVGDDIACGLLTQNPKPEMDAGMAMLVMLLSGR